METSAETHLSCETSRRVVFFSHAATFGGAEKDLFELVIGLRAKPGWEVLVVVPGPGEQAERLLESGVSVVVCSLPWMREVAVSGDMCGTEEGMSRLERGWIELVTRVLSPLEEFQPDVIVTQTCTIPWGYYSAALIGVPHVWNLREYGELDHSLVPMLPGVVDDSAISQSSDLVFTCSDAVGHHWSNRIGRPYTVLYSIPRLSPPTGAQVHAAREMPGLKVVQVGTLGDAKRPGLLIEAIKYMVDEGVDVRVQFVGDGPQRAELEDCAQALGLRSRIEFLGWRSDVAEVVAQAHVAVSCSPNEAQGRTLPEAASLGVVPVFARTQNWAEKFTSGVDSLSYEPGDAASLASSLGELADEILRTELSACAKALAERDFDHRRPADVFGEAVESLLRDRGSSQALSTDSHVAILEILRKQILRAAESEAHCAATERRIPVGELERDRALVAFKTLDRECEFLRMELAEAREELNQIKISRAWRVLKAIQRLRP